LISYAKHSLDQDDIDAVINALKGDWLTQGPACEKFENDLNSYFGSKYSCAVSNGTAALHLVGLALDWQEEDIIITSPNTFLSTVNSIVFSGATPDFVDIEPSTYTIDPNKLEERVKALLSKGKKIKAVIGVDYAGHPCDWESLRDIANRYQFKLINDNCHALGASYLDDKKYAVKYADVVTHSYHPAKHITTGEGGSILTNDKDLDSKVRSLRTHGMTKESNKLFENPGPWYYEMQELGFNYRITDFQCALGSSQLKKLNKFIAKRTKLAEFYNNSFDNYDFIKTPMVKNSSNHAYHLYPLLIDFNNLNVSKLDLFNKMKSKDINLQVHYIPVHLQPFYKLNYGFKKGDFPNSENFYFKELSMPIYPDLTIEELSFVVESLLEGINN
jgi:UDP-4-amino-4,6-dideoxy-N-acetyl-beta-L-altrosamine transaminase